MLKLRSVVFAALAALAALLVVNVSAPVTAAAAPAVMTLRVPEGGIQPQVAVDSRGVVHLIYYKGDPAAGDIYYVRSTDGGQTFSTPIRVNSQPGSAIAAGNIRGAQIAVGRNGRVHVAWNGSGKAQPRGPRNPAMQPYDAGGGAPMLYTRLNDAGTSFEPQRNLIHFTYDLDGGGSVAADPAGNVYVAWHGGAGGSKSETGRRVWIARSSDDGKTFAREIPAWSNPTGACGCCGLRIFADQRDRTYLLYRGAVNGTERGMYLLADSAPGQPFTGTLLQNWHINGCPMSAESFAQDGNSVVGAWETRGQVYFAFINPRTLKPSTPIRATGAGPQRKYPVLATNARGDVLLAWTEGMGWDKSGAVAWQVYNRVGQPIPGENGRVDGVPAWSLVAAFARPDGSFAVVY